MNGILKNPGWVA